MSATVQPPPSPTVSPVPQEPEQPATWWETDEAAAVDAAAYFLELYEYALNTGDLETWNLQSGQTCEFCGNVRKAIENTYSAGDRYIGAELEIDEIKVVGFADTIQVFGVQAKYQLSSMTRVDGDGGVIDEIAAEVGHFILDVAPGVTGWELLGGSVPEEPIG